MYNYFHNINMSMKIIKARVSKEKREKLYKNPFSKKTSKNNRFDQEQPTSIPKTIDEPDLGPKLHEFKRRQDLTTPILAVSYYLNNSKSKKITAALNANEDFEVYQNTWTPLINNYCKIIFRQIQFEFLNTYDDCNSLPDLDFDFCLNFIKVNLKDMPPPEFCGEEFERSGINFDLLFHEIMSNCYSYFAEKLSATARPLLYNRY